MSNAPLTTSALLGTTRNPGLPPCPIPALSTTWEALAKAEPATALLQAAALEHTATIAGATPQEIEIPSATCPEETFPYAPPPAVSALHRILSGEFQENLPEWLHHATAARLLAPPRTIPPLLARATQLKSLRPLISPVLGNRAPWLVAQSQNPEWSWLLESAESTTPTNDETWDTGTLAQRLTYLRTHRPKSPTDTAEKIKNTWPKESPEVREAFTTLAATDPLIEDITWLETLALADRRQATRQAAARALSQLPTSAFHHRSITRARSIIATTKKRLKRHITLIPPEAFDPTWAADGIKEKPPRNTGEKAFWIRQILAQIHPSEWPALLSEETPFSLPIEADWAEPVLLAWSDLARGHPHHPSTPHLLLAILSSPHKKSPALQQIPPQIPEILTPLSNSQRTTTLHTIAPALNPAETIHALVRLQPSIDPKTQPTLFATLTTAISRQDYALTRPEAAALASCPTPPAIPGLLKTISKIKDLPAATEEFARMLEFRQSYLPSF